MSVCPSVVRAVLFVDYNAEILQGIKKSVTPTKIRNKIKKFFFMVLGIIYLS